MISRGEMLKLYPALNSDIDGKRPVYLDNACTMLKSSATVASMLHYYSTLGSCAGARGIYPLADETNDMVESAREDIKRFLSMTHEDEVTWTKNTTESLNLTASCLPLRKSDTAITTIFDHHSALLPLAEKHHAGNLNLKVIGSDSFDINKGIDMDQLLSEFEKVSDDSTALVSLPHVSNVTGQIFPIKKISEIAHRNNALVLVDCAQSISHMDISMSKLGADILAFSSHKLSGPTGLGALCTKEGILDKFNNGHVGGSTVREVKLRKIDSGLIHTGEDLIPTYMAGHKRFEAGVQHYSGILGLSAAISQLKDIGMSEISEHDRQMVQYGSKIFSELEGFSMVCDSDKNRLPIFSFMLTGSKKAIEPNDIALYLGRDLPKESIMVRSGRMCADPFHHLMAHKCDEIDGSGDNQAKKTIRASAHVYNTKEDLESFFSAVKEFMRLTK